MRGEYQISTGVSLYRSFRTSLVNIFMNFKMAQIVSVGALLMLCSCSTFHRDWKKAAALSAPSDIQGAWEGTWTSEPSGHSGKLFCLVEKMSEQSYRARFDSTYKKLLHFKSTVTLNGATTNHVFTFSGAAKLPWWAGGLYRYEGRASATNFFSTYQCKYDHGTFQMTRP